MNLPNDNIKIFYSYSHKDIDFLNELSVHLFPYQEDGQITITNWYDGYIKPGDNWLESIDEQLYSSQIIILIISTNFLSSKQCRREVRIALERLEKDEVRIIPILLSESMWKRDPLNLSKLQCLPKNATPVDKWPSKEQAILNIVNGLLDILLINNGKSTSPYQKDYNFHDNLPRRSVDIIGRMKNMDNIMTALVSLPPLVSQF